MTVIRIDGMSVALDEISMKPLCDPAPLFCCYRVIDNKVKAIFYGLPVEQ